MLISGNIVDIVNSKIYPGTLKISRGKIINIEKENKRYNYYIVPGFVDSHLHIESSMLTPSEFGRVAVIHGTVGVIADPHEIANVLGVRGIKYMIRDAKKTPLKFYFCAPSCVPATNFETNGANISIEDVKQLIKLKEIVALGEVMNFQGVITRDKEIIEKIKIAKRFNKKVDGHAPGLRGKNLKKYIEVGISTDHECIREAEALEKIKLGMKIQIREGSAAKNLNELLSIIEHYHENCMFCSDDLHPNDLVKWHINKHIEKSLKQGYDIIKILRAASLNPILHYNLDIGLLQKNDPADFLVVDLDNFKILKTYINGKLIAKNGKSLISRASQSIINKFKTKKKKIEEFRIKKEGRKIRVIKALDRDIITEKIITDPKVINDNVVSDCKRDILKIVVVNRYKNEKPIVSFIKNFGLKEGAIASSISHDSHNIIAVGVNDEDICKVINLIIENKGGIAVVSKKSKSILKLPIAGLISNKNYKEIAKKYELLDRKAKKLGSKLKSPFMTLSFMALPVIPKLKITNKGLFDVEKFRFVDLFN